jgi:CHAT domain-containing protein
MKRLDDYYDLRPVTSTANIINLKNKQVTYQSAVVYGGINFDKPIVDMVAGAKKYEKLEPDNNNLLATRGALDRQGWHALPGTLVEANNVSKKLEEMPIKVSLYEGNAANEESFKSMDGNAPDILHIATHGFSEASIEETKSTYLQNATSNSKMNLSMLLSGLLFAGANNTWKGNTPQNAEDGILTADEISRLDLSNSKLIVLSACKTALGVTDYVDGVFGLQRGFKRAGVGSMVMSLWPVDDNATEKLMDLFYENICLGKEAHQAFRDAQQSLKKQMPSPYYWAGFVMID